MTAIDSDEIRAIPKIELHVHLEGSIGPELLLDLATRNGLDVKAQSVAELDRRFDFQSFHDFLMLFGELTYALQRPEDFTEAVMAYAETASAEGVIYCEMTVTMSTHVRFKGMNPIEILEALWVGAQEAQRRFSIMIRFVINYVRSFPPEGFSETIEYCLEGRQYGVVALGFGGPEAGFPPSRFDAEMRRARALGIPFVPHAGEAADASSVWDSLQYSPTRIGHGVTAAGDQLLLSKFRDDQVMIEACLSSNVALGHIDSVDRHPTRTFFDFGVPISLNTDDPPMFRTSILREYDLAATHLGFNIEELLRLNKRALDFALVGDGKDRAWLSLRFDEALSSLRALQLPNT